VVDSEQMVSLTNPCIAAVVTRRKALAARVTCIGYFRDPFEKVTDWPFTIHLFFFVI